MTEYTYSYEGDNIYPSSCTFESSDEGWYSEGTITYEYFEFDKKGNWTERTLLTTTTVWNMEEEGEAEKSEFRLRERRIITYWSDKN